LELVGIVGVARCERGKERKRGGEQAQAPHQRCSGHLLASGKKTKSDEVLATARASKREALSFQPA